MDTLTFHADAQRTGWRSSETSLVPAVVSEERFGLVWESPEFDEVEDIPPRLYASPLYVDEVTLSVGKYQGLTFAVVFAATSNGFVYAVNASSAHDVPPGTILWRSRLGTPCRRGNLLDGVLTGVLSTPVIDIESERLYVTSCERKDSVEVSWRAHALDISSGRGVPGWPVELNLGLFNRPGFNKNAGSGGPAPERRFDYTVQRGALNLSPDGRWLYIVFGDSSTGWLVSADTNEAAIASAFATVAEPHTNSGGIWGSGGPAVDAQGNVFIVTGTNFSGYVDQPHDWVQSVLKLSMEPEGFELRGSYTPFNYCRTAEMDIDLGSGGASVLPSFSESSTVTPDLLVLGGKQGNVYLVDRTDMPGSLDRRQPCSSDSSSDQSLLPPGDQAQFGKRGPLNVFGPYTETHAAMNLARSRSVPAFFRDENGQGYVFVTGTTMIGEAVPVGVPPSIARLKVVVASGQAAYLELDRRELSLTLANPGSPVVTSNGAKNAIVWVLDTNAERTASLTGSERPKPVLYALDALTLKLLWKSAPGQLRTGGKYNQPAFGRGKVFVGTDRIQSFGIAAQATTEGTAHGPIGRRAYRQHCTVRDDQAKGRVPPKALEGR